jgi:hypothetical protein
VTADGSIILKGIQFSVGRSVEVIVLDDVSDLDSASQLDAIDLLKPKTTTES